MQELLNGDGKAGGGDQDRLPEPMTGVQRHDHQPTDHRAPESGECGRHRESDGDTGERIAAPERHQHRDGADRTVGAEHRDFAEREIDPAGDP